MTYLELVNSVLRRLRETEVSSVSDNAYSKMISDFVNDAKRTVEDSYNWNALYNTITIPTVNNTASYTLTGSGQRFKLIDAINDTSNWFLHEGSKVWFDEQLLVENPTSGSPTHYIFQGTDSSNNTKVKLYPTPNGVYSLVFNVVLPQTALTSNTDVVKVPSEPIVFLAYAKALAERGEDGGLASGEAAQLYRQSLADAIAIENGRHFDESQFYWV
jgi:hypothetical protein